MGADDQKGQGMAWIKMRTNLATDGRVILIASAVKKSRVYVIGALYILWALADEHSTDGHLPGYNASTIDAATGIRGFAVAAQAAGWLNLQDDGSTIPRFDEHNGASAKERAQTARRQSRRRHASVTPKSQESNAATVTRASPREEESREEKRRTTTSEQVVVADAPSAESSPPPLCGTESRIRRWTGDRLSAADRSAIAAAERKAEESPPVEIHGKPVPFSDLFTRAVEEAIASNGTFTSGRKFMGFVDTIAARCTRDGVWPGEGLERQNGHGKAEPTVAELRAVAKARRAP